MDIQEDNDGLRVAVVQMDPKIFNKALNIQTANRLISGIVSPIDLIVLPEFGLIGYCFENKEEITPLCELAPTQDDVDAMIAQIDGEENKEVEENKAGEQQPSTLEFCLKVSKRYAPAWIVVGFAEKDTEGNLFNSAMAVNYQLRTCHVIRKVLLYKVDKNWQHKLESEFSGIEHNYQYRDMLYPRLERTIRCGIAICMDILWKDMGLPEEEESARNTYPLANFLVANNCQLLIFPTAWPKFVPDDFEWTEEVNQ